MQKAVLRPGVVSLFVLGSQRFAADLLTFIVALLWWFWVGLHVSAVEAEKGQKTGAGLSTLVCVCLCVQAALVHTRFC